MSLSQFSGKVVMLAFESIEGTTRLTADHRRAMLQAKQILGAGGNQVASCWRGRNPDQSAPRSSLYSRTHRAWSTSGTSGPARWPTKATGPSTTSPSRSRRPDRNHTRPVVMTSRAGAQSSNLTPMPTQSRPVRPRCSRRSLKTRCPDTPRWQPVSRSRPSQEGTLGHPRCRPPARRAATCHARAGPGRVGHVLRHLGCPRSRTLKSGTGRH